MSRLLKWCWNKLSIFPKVDQSGLGLPSREYYLNKTANEKVRLYFFINLLNCLTQRCKTAYNYILMLFVPSVFKCILKLLGGSGDPSGWLKGDLSEDDGGNRRLWNGLGKHHRPSRSEARRVKDLPQDPGQRVICEQPSIINNTVEHSYFRFVCCTWAGMIVTCLSVL